MVSIRNCEIIVRCIGKGLLTYSSINIVLWRSCNLTAFTPCLTGPVDYLFASCHEGPGFKSPWGYLCETGILLLALSATLVTPTWLIIVASSEVGLVWGGLRPEPSLGHRADNVIIPLDLTQLFCPCFMLAAGPPFGFTTDIVGCWGGALWRACNLTAFTPCLTGPVDYLFASRHEGPRFKSLGWVLMWTGILLFALSCYSFIVFYLFSEGLISRRLLNIKLFWRQLPKVMLIHNSCSEMIGIMLLFNHAYFFLGNGISGKVISERIYEKVQLQKIRKH